MKKTYTCKGGTLLCSVLPIGAGCLQRAGDGYATFIALADFQCAGG